MRASAREHGAPDGESDIVRDSYYNDAWQVVEVRQGGDYVKKILGECDDASGYAKEYGYGK